MEKCEVCGKERAHYVQDFLIVNRSISGGGFAGMTTTTESLSGAERHTVCKKCLLKKATRHALLVGLGTTIGSFFFIGFVSGSKFHSVLPLILLSIIYGFLAGIATELAGLFLQKFRVGHLRDFASKYSGSSDTNKIYIPVGKKLYQNEQSFQKVNSQLVTDIHKRLYAVLIATGSWEDYVAMALVLADLETAPMPTANVPEGEHKMLLNECVQELLRLYRQTPDGFLTNSAAAQPVRAIGKKLDEAGGFKLMLQAHELFAANSPGMGLARNLEMVWDGIGGWRG